MGVWKCSLLQHNLVYFNQSTICGAQSAFVDAPPKYLMIILLECLNQTTIEYNRSSIWDHTGISHQNLHTISTESYFSSAHSGLCVFFFLHILRGGRKLAPSAHSFIFRSLSHRRSLASATVGADNKYGEAIYNHNSSMRPFQASWPSWGFANLSLSISLQTLSHRMWACNFSTWDAKAEESQVWGRLGLNTVMLFQQNKTISPIKTNQPTKQLINQPTKTLKHLTLPNFAMQFLLKHRLLFPN